MLKHMALAAALMAASSAHAAPQIGKVFVIALENHNFTQPSSYTATQPLFGNSAAPYLNSLITPGNANAAMSSYASNYINVAGIHPSEPNYVWAEAGVAGPLNDNDPYPGNIVSAPNLTGLMQSNGMSWRSYQEGTDLVTNGLGQLTNTVKPTSAYTVPLQSFSGVSTAYTNPYNGSHQYNYAAKHDPQVFFTATNGGNDTSASNPLAHNYAPMEQLASDLAGNTVADYSWITPDQYNDMHSGLTGGFTYNGTLYTGDAAKIAQGDDFLSMVVPMIEASQAFQNNGVIVIWNDETEGEPANPAGSGFTSTEIVISPLAKGNAYNSSFQYTHSSDLRTMQEIFGLSPAQGFSFLGGAADARDLSDLFKAGAVSGVPEPSTWALSILGFGLAGAMMRRRRSVAAQPA
jgi:hypothetical protein